MHFHFNCAHVIAYFEEAKLDPWRKLRTITPKEQYNASIGDTSAVVMRLNESVSHNK